MIMEKQPNSEKGWNLLDDERTNRDRNFAEMNFLEKQADF
jgi:hypothetical protein